jgi:predicted ATPase
VRRDANLHRIFLSYRREDSAGYAGRLHDTLAMRFGPENVFLDVDSIEPGANFETVLEETLAGCDTFLVLIGPRWSDTEDASGRKRLFDRTDYVRREIELALSTGTTRIIPVLVDGTHLPDPGDLPDSIAPLVKHQAVSLSNANWPIEVRILADKLASPVIRSRKEASTRGLRPSRTSFVGRQSELAELRNLIQHTRLLTILGPGGVGKTRVAYRLAEELSDEFHDGIYGVELAPVTGSPLVFDAVKRALPIGDSSEEPLDAALAFLAHREALLVLDNCEHVLHGAADFADRILDESTSTVVLATSRAPLGVVGEILFALEPFTVPNDEAALADSVGSDAVELFSERARGVRRGFIVDESNVAAVVEICRRLDGLPLAIELAGARIATMAPGELLTDLTQHLTKLGSNARGLPERHRTMESMIAWSFGLLSEAEQVLIARLSVFVGSFPRSWAEVVCGFTPLCVGETFGCIETLATQSLLGISGDSNVERYELLVSVREFAAQQLERFGESIETQRRLADFLATHLKPRDRLFQFTSDTTGYLAEVAVAANDIRSSLQWCLEHGEAQRACSLIAIGFRWWNVTGRIKELLPLALRAIAFDQSPSFDLVMTYYAALLALDIVETEHTANEELPSGEQLRCDMISVAWANGDDEAKALALYCKADLPWAAGEFTEAARVLNEAADLALNVSNESLAATIRRSEAEALSEGDDSRLASLLDPVLDQFRRAGDPMGTSVTLAVLAVAELGLGRTVAASRHIAEGLAMATEHGYTEIRWRHLTLAAWTSAAMGSPAIAARLLGSVEFAVTKAGGAVGRGQGNAADYIRIANAARAQLGDDEYAEAHEAGTRMQEAQADELARSLVPQDTPDLLT